MKVKRGTSRIVFFCGSFVLKFCRIQPLLNMFEDIWKEVWQGHWSLINPLCKLKWSAFKKGIRQNVTEYRCWRAIKAPFLVPTYMSLGVINIQKLEKGDQPTAKEIWGLIKALGAKPRYQAEDIDTHCWNEKNFLRNERGYHIVDYGDASSRPSTFPQFIAKWQNEMTNVFCQFHPPSK